MLNVKIKRLSVDAYIPTYGSNKAAGLDLYANIGIGWEYARTTTGMHHFPKTIDIAPHTAVKIGTGWAIQPPEGYCGLIFARSGLATKQGLRPANCVGLCDEDYTGEYIVALYNDTDETQIIHHGDRIAQLVFMPYEQVAFTEVDELDSTERGDEGFGHTGK
jgi:dUTP pyrophosphatase